MASEKLQATPTKDAGGNISWKLCDAKVPTDCGTLGSNPVTALPHSFFPKTYNFEITVTNDQTGLGIVFAPIHRHPRARTMVRCGSRRIPSLRSLRLTATYPLKAGAARRRSNSRTRTREARLISSIV